MQQLCRSGGWSTCSSSRPFTHTRTAPATSRICRAAAGPKSSSPAHPTQHDLSAATRYAMSGIALAVVGSLLVEPALAAELSTNATPTPVMEQFQLAENQEFWGNVLRYGRYFVTVMLGTGYVMLRPFTAAFKNPVSAILAIAGLAGSVFLVKFTLEAMLGIGNDLPFDYVQGSF